MSGLLFSLFVLAAVLGAVAVLAKDAHGDDPFSVLRPMRRLLRSMRPLSLANLELDILAGALRQADIGLTARYLPPRLVVRAHPTDAATLRRRQAQVEDDLARKVRESPDCADYLITGTLRIDVVDDQSRCRGDVRVDADWDASAPARTSPADDDVEGTRAPVDGRTLPLPAPSGLELRSLDGRLSLRADSPFAVIGRDPASDLVVDGNDVSRAHAMLTLDPDGWTVNDKSRNGTFVNGERIASVRLNDGDVVRFGTGASFLVRLTPADATLDADVL
jgi:hypothetical protein